MIIIDALFTKLENETDLELLWRVGSSKELNNLTWDQVAMIMNELTGKNKSESSWRKKYSSMNKVVNKENTKESLFSTLSYEDMNNKSENNIDSDLRKIEIAKIQFRDERKAWNKQNYATARVLEKLNYLEKTLTELGRINFKEHEIPCYENSENELIVILSDWHIGQSFKNFIGEYNISIAQKRIYQLLEAVKENAKLYNTEKVHILCCGDMISGSIHKSVQITNGENVINQIKTTTELISSFCYECTNIFKTVQFYSVSGNHSRMDRKEDAIHDERLDDIISWAVNLSLSHLTNFHYMSHRNIDSGIVEMDVCNNFYIAVHGDYDPATKTGTSDLSMMLGFMPKVILRGHLHTSSLNEYNGVKVIQGGSLSGAGDQYTLEKRLIGKASQTILICNKKGVKVHIPIELD